MIRLLILSIFCFFSSCGLSSADSFDGTWVHRSEDASATATITVQGGSLQGQVNEDGETYAFVGTISGTRASIHIAMDGEQVPATLDLLDGELIAELDGERYRYQRVGAQRAPIADSKPTPVAQQTQPMGHKAQASTHVAPASGHVVLERKTLLDAGMKNMPSHTILVPKGWQVKGGAWWAASAYFKVMPSQDITITSPNGVELHIAPCIIASDFRPSAEGINLGGRRPAEWQSDNGNPVIYQPTNDGEWRRKLAEGVKTTVPTATNIRVEEFVVVPQLTTILQQRMQPLLANPQPGGFCNATVYAASIRFSNAEKEWEQLSIFGITNMGSNSQFGQTLYWSVEPNVTYRAPLGQLEATMPLLIALANSLGQTPEWMRMVSEHARKINQTASFKPSVIADSGPSVSDIMFEGWKKRESIKSPSRRRVIESIHEVNTYSTGSGNVQLPAGYNNVYSNGQGDFILSNDSLYQPNTDNSINQQNWQTIQVKP